MAEILFYHLTETRLEQTLPSLLEKTIAKGWRACIHCGDEAKLKALDDQLWVYQEDSFLAHGQDCHPHSETQPVLLTLSADCLNKAEVRFVVHSGPEPKPEELRNCARIVYIFDGHDPMQLEHARAQWKRLSENDIEKTYWQQTPERRWVKKA